METERIGTSSISPDIQRLSPSYDVIELVGEAGTGTTTTGKVLAEIHGARYVGIGDIMRIINIHKEGSDILGERNVTDDTVDEKINRLGEIIFENFLKPNYGRGPVVVDSRLGAILAKTAEKRARENKQPFPKIVTLRLTSDPNIAAQRISQRQEINIKEALQKNADRNKKDREIFSRLLRNEGIEDDPYSDSIFDLTIDTSGIPIIEVVGKINTWLRENDYLKNV